MPIESEKTTTSTWRRWVKASLDAIGSGGGTPGALQLSDLDDVNTSTPTDKFALMADGVDFESRALVEADISDLTHTPDAHSHVAADTSDFDTEVSNNASVAANTSKVSNVTHTGDVAGATELTIGAKKVQASMMEDGVDGELFTWGATGVLEKVAVGTSGQVLVSNGVGAAPTFQTINLATGWEKIGETTPADAQTFDITWDESLYVAIRLEYEDLETDTDNSSFNCRLGHTNGTVIFDQTGDYEGHIHAYSATLQNMSTTSIITLHSAWGNATNEGIQGTLELTGYRKANYGAMVWNRCMNKNAAGDMQGLVAEAHLEGTNVGAIDTIRFEVQGGAKFLNSGVVKAYGLLL